jgi:hypothetical protein
MKKIILLLTVLAGATSVIAQKAVSIESLLKELVDRDEIARFPDPAYSCKQFSSYDRGTVAENAPGWFANDDRSMFIRVEKDRGRREFVMMDTAGPGAVVRFWMTFAGNGAGRGILRIYIDDCSKPAIEGRALDIVSGTLVAAAPLAASVPESAPYDNRGHSLYFPLPYAKSCKITYESEHLYEDDPGARRGESEAVYYNINYRTYEQGTTVIPYSLSEMKKNKPLIDRVQKQLQLKDRGIDRLKLSVLPMNVTLRAGESRSFVISGANAIRQLHMELNAGDRKQALRSTVIEMIFDGEKTVWSPAGDFYGCGYESVSTSTWYTQVEKDGAMDAFWVMPFRNECVITLHNLGNQEVQVLNAFAACNKWKWDNRSMHFGTAWQQYTRIHAGPEEEAQDVNFVALKGKGVFVGDGVVLYNTAAAWWGEGDEKVYVDGKTFPSHIGTGSEDYYGYAWGRPEIFTGHPFIAQPSGAGNNLAGYTVNTRLRGLDGIPFTQSIRFDMELWHHRAKTRVNYAPVAYWYLLPGGQKLTKEDLSGAKAPVAVRRSDVYSNKLKPSIEGENMIPGQIPVGVTEFQTNFRTIWSEGMQMYWKEIETGAKATFEFESDFEGDYNVSALFTVAPDYGIFNIFLNDCIIAENLDLYRAAIAVSTIDMGKGSLRRGKNTLGVELVQYPKGFGKSCFGIDRLIFEKSNP